MIPRTTGWDGLHRAPNSTIVFARYAATVPGPKMAAVFPVKYRKPLARHRR